MGIVGVNILMILPGIRVPIPIASIWKIYYKIYVGKVVKIYDSHMKKLGISYLAIN